MKRWLVMSLMACVIIGVGLIAATFLSSKTLASSTINVGGATVRFQITERNGLLYVSAREHQAWSNGWETILLVGSANEAGIDSVAILAEGDDRARLHIGKKVIEFDNRPHSYLVQ